MVGHVETVQTHFYSVVGCHQKKTRDCRHEEAGQVYYYSQTVHGS